MALLDFTDLVDLMSFHSPARLLPGDIFCPCPQVRPHDTWTGPKVFDFVRVDGEGIIFHLHAALQVSCYH